MISENTEDLKYTGFDQSFPLSTNDTFEEDIKKLRERCRGIGLPKGYVPDTTLFLLHKNKNRIVGGINIRHLLTDNIRYRGGHIGYYICCNDRKKGFAKIMLKKGLGFCKQLGIFEVLITCSKDNIASIKTIIANDGILKEECNDNGEVFQRYWIKL